MTDSSIVLEDETSWPDDVLPALHSALASLEDYHLFEREVDQEYEETGNIMLKCSPPRNPHRELRERCLADIDVKLQEHSMVGYHCTKLTPEEVERVKTKGLTRLSPEFVEARLCAAREDGHLTVQEESVLRQSALVDESSGRRNHMTWYLFNRGGLRSESGLWRFFHYWGGEALYVPHQETGLGAKLSEIGLPAVVEANVPIKHLNRHVGMAERFEAAYLIHRGKHHPQEYGFEAYSTVDLDGSQILNVHTLREPWFEKTTHFSTWRPT